MKYLMPQLNNCKYGVNVTTYPSLHNIPVPTVPPLFMTHCKQHSRAVLIC